MRIGRRRGAREQGRRIHAGGQRLERGDHLERVIHQRSIGPMREEIQKRANLRQPPAETRHPSIEQLARLLAAQGGQAGRPVQLGPATDMGVNLVRSSSRARPGMRTIRGSERVPHPGRHGLVPHRGDLLARARAALLAQSGGRGCAQRDSTGDHHRPDRQAELDAPPLQQRHPAKRDQQAVHARMAILWPPPQPALDRPLEPGRNAPALARRPRRGLHRRPVRGRGRLAALTRRRRPRRQERMLAEQRLVKSHAEAELVGPGVARDPGPLLGSHVRRRPLDRARRRDRPRDHAAARRPLAPDITWRRPGLRRGSGETEIGHHHPPVGADQEVRRLEVAVNEAGGVGSGEPPARLDQHGHDLRP